MGDNQPTSALESSFRQVMESFLGVKKHPEVDPQKLLDLCLTGAAAAFSGRLPSSGSLLSKATFGGNLQGHEAKLLEIQLGRTINSLSYFSKGMNKLNHPRFSTKVMYFHLSPEFESPWDLIVKRGSDSPSLSKYFHKARREFLCAATITVSPALIRGTIFSCKAPLSAVGAFFGCRIAKRPKKRVKQEKNSSVWVQVFDILSCLRWLLFDNLDFSLTHSYNFKLNS